MKLVIAWSLRAWGQEFPEGEDAWQVLPCRGHPTTDPWRDEPGATDERDLVGDERGPTAAHAADDDFVYLRMRLDQDPQPAGEVRPFAWAWLFDTDGERSTYEAMGKVDGVSGQVELRTNSVTTEPDLPDDPPDEPALASWPVEERARSVVADSSWGEDSDHWLEIALPWDSLDEVGVLPVLPVHVWVATSSNAGALDGDFACHDAASGLPPSLSATAGQDEPDGEPDDPLLEGGGGCRSVASGPSWLGLLLGLRLLRRRS